MDTEQISIPKHLAIHFTNEEYQTVEKIAAASGQTLDNAVYAALLVKLGAAMQEFISENGLQNVVIDIEIQAIADDDTDEDLAVIRERLGDALRDDGSIDYAKLDAKTEITDLDEWERNS